MGDSPAGCRNSRRKRALTAWRAACGVGAVWPARLAPRAPSTSAVAPRRRRSTRSCAPTWRRCTGPSTTAPSPSGYPSTRGRELRAYLDCGLLCRGFARLRCDRCEDSRLVAFSCKGRGFCPSCLD
ncbi:transposase zinc-binding domain-containing protein [Sorangium sp. So ce341]|uniref:transposase zinc-binding domain-containing protein n=1 Tax=Sorangium sp. So ce341 TaxID=3133302 RepID=UPI003F5E4F98